MLSLLKWEKNHLNTKQLNFVAESLLGVWDFLCSQSQQPFAAWGSGSSASIGHRFFPGQEGWATLSVIPSWNNGIMILRISWGILLLWCGGGGGGLLSGKYVLPFYNSHTANVLTLVLGLSRSTVSYSFAIPWTVVHPAPLSMGILQAKILEWIALPSSRGIFPAQGLNPGLPHCRWILYLLSHQEAPLPWINFQLWLIRLNWKGKQTYH